MRIAHLCENWWLARAYLVTVCRLRFHRRDALIVGASTSGEVRLQRLRHRIYRPLKPAVDRIAKGPVSHICLECQQLATPPRSVYEYDRVLVAEGCGVKLHR